MKKNSFSIFFLIVPFFLAFFVVSTYSAYGQMFKDRVVKGTNQKENMSSKPYNAYIDIKLWDAPNLRKQSSGIEVWVYDGSYYPVLVKQPKFGPTKLTGYYKYSPGTPATIQLTEGTNDFPMNDYEVDGATIKSYKLYDGQLVACSVTNITDFLGVWWCHVYFAPEPRPGFYDETFNQQPKVD